MIQATSEKNASGSNVKTLPHAVRAQTAPRMRPVVRNGNPSASVRYVQ